MATVLERPSSIDAKAQPDVAAFSDDLTRLCQRHGLGLTDGATLYLMEPEDYSRAASVNEKSELTFA